MRFSVLNAELNLLVEGEDGCSQSGCSKSFSLTAVSSWVVSGIVPSGRGARAGRLWGEPA